MLPHSRAQYYFKSLHFNHYESGGTCEQRVLVLRARFDRVLEELTIKDYDSQNAYVEKLQQVFSALPERFTEDKKKEFHALRMYLNGVQHSTFEADEPQYKLSLKRLCDLISLCSGEDIPEELKVIWNNNNEERKIKCVNFTPRKYGFEQQKVRNTIELPFVLFIDCLSIENNEVRRNHFNHSLQDLISKIADDGLSVNLRLILIEKNKIKYVVTKTGESSIFSYEKVCEDVLVNAIGNTCDFIQSRIKCYKENKHEIYNPSGLAVFMLSAECANILTTPQKTIKLEENMAVQIIPVGLTSGMDLKSFQKISLKNNALILKDDKYEMFFNWLHESLKMICNKENTK